MTPLPLKALARVDRLWLGARKAKSGVEGKPVAGAGVQARSAVPVKAVGDVWWVDFPTLAHSFWRSQEVTFFRNSLPALKGRWLDLGCGDGLFGLAAGFPEDIAGADYDVESLAARSLMLPRAESRFADARCLPYPEGTFDGIVSNSVFEHLPDLPQCFAEIHRVLRPGGVLAFTMTLGSFTDHLRIITGEEDARFWTTTFGHHQQPTAAELKQLLERMRFKTECFREYQPLAATSVYRSMLSPAAQFLERKRAQQWREKRISNLVPIVERSINECPVGEGACAWAIARKPA